MTDFAPDSITIRKDYGGKANSKLGREVTVEKFHLMLDADGNVKASVIQFPITLAYATTIHKSQGANSG